MSISTLACEFVSYARFVNGRVCGDEATHRVDTRDLCRAHWLYESGAFPVCGLCKNPRYEDTWVIQAEHTCTEGDRGWDCMHFEGDEHCDCESQAKESFETADRTPAVVDGACVDCEYENEADVLYVNHDGEQVPTCYECVRDYEDSAAYYKDMMDASGQY
jgi:hypothetical protein